MMTSQIEAGHTRSGQERSDTEADTPSRPRLPRTAHAEPAASDPAGNRNHLCRLGVHLVGFG
jgi:hypothetical protein